MKMKCDWCGKSVYKTPAYVKKNEHVFCDRKCYFQYMKVHRISRKGTRSDMRYQHKLKHFALLKKGVEVGSFIPTDVV